MKKLPKFVAASVVLIVIIVVLIVSCSSTDTRLQCTGTLTRQSVASPMTIFVKITEYRWWVGLWSESHGALWVEIPHEASEYYERVSRNGENLLISSSSSRLGVGGLYSKLSDTLSLHMPMGVFDGSCQRADSLLR